MSKRWKDLIMDPCFFKVYDERNERTSGSFCKGKLMGFVRCNVRINSYSPPKYWKHSCVSVKNEEFGVGDFFPPKRSCFMASSNNGLVLWGCNASKYRRSEYHVGNPITKTWVSLPPPPPPLSLLSSKSVGLTSKDEYVKGSASNINFRVIVATGSKSSRTLIPIDTYSSRSGKWRRLKLVSPESITVMQFSPPTVCGELFHWNTLDGCMAVFDSSSLDEEDGLMGEYSLKLVKVPNSIGPIVVWRTDNGRTLWWGVCCFDGGVEIYRKSDDSNDWTLMREVADTSTFKRLIKLRPKDAKIESKARWAAREGRDDLMLSRLRDTVWMTAFVPWDPTLVIVRVWERVFFYDWVNHTMTEILLDGNSNHFTDFETQWYPYFHPLSLASYAFK